MLELTLFILPYENTQETLALLKILALGSRQIEEGRVVSATDAFANVRRHLQTRTMSAVTAAKLSAPTRVTKKRDA